ncbi:MAG: DUF1127 domain-containing protein [Xanthobacteraceae bacterium]
MNMSITTYGSRRASYWNQVRSQFAEWRRRSYSRHELQFLSDQTLRDIGLTACEVHREATKPFWMA